MKDVQAMKNYRLRVRMIAEETGLDKNVINRPFSHVKNLFKTKAVEQKTNRMEICQDSYFLDKVIIGDESWVF